MLRHCNEENGLPLPQSHRDLIVSSGIFVQIAVSKISFIDFSTCLALI